MAGRTAPPSSSPHPPSSPGSSPPLATSSTNTNESPSSSTTPTPAVPRMPVFSNGRLEAPPPNWYDTCTSVPLGVNDYLSGGAHDPASVNNFLGAFSNGRPELPPPKWYDTSVPLGVNEDMYYLSELQCVLRSDFVEAFGTTQVR